jgi:hypothetical protein
VRLHDLLGAPPDWNTLQAFLPEAKEQVAPLERRSALGGKRRIARRFWLVDKSNLARFIAPVAAHGDKSGSSNLDAEDAEIAAYVATLHDLHNRLDENQVSQDNPDLAMRHMGMDRKAAILLINGSAMEDCAYKSVHGAKVLRDIRTVSMWISAHHAKYRAQAEHSMRWSLRQRLGAPDHTRVRLAGRCNSGRSLLTGSDVRGIPAPARRRDAGTGRSCRRGSASPCRT